MKTLISITKQFNSNSNFIIDYIILFKNNTLKTLSLQHGVVFNNNWQLLFTEFDSVMEIIESFPKRTIIQSIAVYQMIQIISIHCFAYWLEILLYVYYMFLIWIIYDVSISIMYGITHLFGYILDHSPGLKDWMWYIVFALLLLLIQLPTNIIQLIIGWTVMNAVISIICVWISLVIYQYIWMDDIIEPHRLFDKGVAFSIIRIHVILSISIGLCCVLTFYSFILVLSTSIIWYLLLICGISYLIFILLMLQGPM